MDKNSPIQRNLQNKFERSVSLICWAYNEEDSVQEYLVKATGLLDSAVEDYEIILIDDGSHDRTYEIASAFQKNNPRVEIFQNWKNMGVGISCQRAIKKASKEFLFWQTVDWCYDITDLRVFLEYLKKYDIVQGVRRRPVEVRVKLLKPVIGIMKLFGIKHLTKRSDTIPKAIVTIINYLLIRILFKIQLSDFQNVTFYPTSWIQSVRFETKSSFVSPEILIKAHWSGMSIKEVPINFIPRSQGIPKGTRLRSIVSSVRDIFKLWFRWVVIGKRKFIRKGKIVRLNFLEPS